MCNRLQIDYLYMRSERVLEVEIRTVLLYLGRIKYTHYVFSTSKMTN